MRDNLAILNKTAHSVRSIPFLKIKEKVLGKGYDLSVVLLKQAEMRKVTLRTKKKDKVSNVLAFALTRHSGEVLLCPSVAKPYSVTHLFIHGCLHLKGMTHGSTMECIEQKLLLGTRPSTHAKNSNRNRHWLVSR